MGDYFKMQYEKLADELDRKARQYIPKIGEKYFCIIGNDVESSVDPADDLREIIPVDFCVVPLTFRDDEISKRNESNGNCFKTRGEAMRMLSIIKAILRNKEDILEDVKEVIKPYWTEKSLFDYEINDGEIYVVSSVCISHTGIITTHSDLFTSKEEAFFKFKTETNLELSVLRCEYGEEEIDVFEHSTENKKTCYYTVPHGPKVQISIENKTINK